MRETRAAILRDALLRALLLALAAALVVALRLLERGEALSPRTLTLVAMLAGAAALAMLVVSAALDRFLAGDVRLRIALGGPLATLGMLALFFAAFAATRNASEFVLSLQEDGWRTFVRHVVIGMTLDAGGVFVVMGRGYLLPWPLPAILAAACLAMGVGGRRPR